MATPRQSSKTPAAKNSKTKEPVMPQQPATEEVDTTASTQIDPVETTAAVEETAVATESVVQETAPAATEAPAPVAAVPPPPPVEKQVEPVKVLTRESRVVETPKKVVSPQQALVEDFSSYFKSQAVFTPGTRAILIEKFKKMLMYCIDYPEVGNLALVYDFLEQNRGAMLATETVFGTTDNITPSIRNKMSILYTAIVMTMDCASKKSKIAPNLDVVRQTLNREEIVAFLGSKLD